MSYVGNVIRSGGGGDAIIIHGISIPGMVFNVSRGVVTAGMHFVICQMFRNGGMAAAVVTLLIAAWVACDNMIVLIRLAEKTGKSSYGQVCAGLSYSQDGRHCCCVSVLLLCDGFLYYCCFCCPLHTGTSPPPHISLRTGSAAAIVPGGCWRHFRCCVLSQRVCRAFLDLNNGAIPRIAWPGS